MTTNEVLNRVFSEAEKNGDVKRVEHSDKFTEELLKINKKNGRSGLAVSIVLAILSITFLVLVFSGILRFGKGYIIINVFVFILPFAPIILLISNHKSNKRIKEGSYSAYLCSICEVDKNYGYIKGIPKKVFVEGIGVNTFSNLKNIKVGDKVFAIIVGNDYYTIPYDEKMIMS